MPESFSIHTFLPASPAAIYEAWIDARRHAAMTGSPASGTAAPGKPYSAWEGYITGTFVALEPPARLVLAWRTTDFAVDDPDSTVELVLEGSDTETRLTINHTNVPAGTTESYRDGWRAFYFEPMRKYFEGLHPDASDAATPAPAKKRPPPRRATAAKKTPAPKKKAAAKKTPAPKKKAAPKTVAKKTAAAKKKVAPKTKISKKK